MDAASWLPWAFGWIFFPSSPPIRDSLPCWDNQVSVSFKDYACLVNIASNDKPTQVRLMNDIFTVDPMEWNSLSFMHKDQRRWICTNSTWKISRLGSTMKRRSSRISWRTETTRLVGIRRFWWRTRLNNLVGLSVDRTELSFYPSRLVCLSVTLSFLSTLPCLSVCLTKLSFNPSHSQVEVKTSFEDFTEFLKEDSRAETLDIGNIRLAYNGYMEKVIDTVHFYCKVMLSNSYCQLESGKLVRLNGCVFLVSCATAIVAILISTRLYSNLMVLI